MLNSRLQFGDGFQIGKAIIRNRFGLPNRNVAERCRIGQRLSVNIAVTESQQRDKN